MCFWRSPDLKSPRMLFLEDSLGKPREAREVGKLRQEGPQNSLDLETIWQELRRQGMPQSRMGILRGRFWKAAISRLSKLAEVLPSGGPWSQGIRNRKDLRGSGCYHLVFHILRDPKMQILLETDENPVDLMSASGALWLRFSAFAHLFIYPSIHSWNIGHLMFGHLCVRLCARYRFRDSRASHIWLLLIEI